MREAVLSFVDHEARLLKQQAVRLGPGQGTFLALHFDEAPPIVNLFDPDITTRAAFVDRLRRQRWTGRIVWLPISAMATALVGARAALSLLRGRLPSRLSAWSILRPRRYDDRIATKVLDACR